MKEEFKLEFHFNNEGLFICGNKKGLEALAKNILDIADSENYDHKHLNFSWLDRMQSGNFIVNFDYVESTERAPKVRDEFDVTVMKTPCIGIALWDNTIDNSPSNSDS